MDFRLGGMASSEAQWRIAETASRTAVLSLTTPGGVQLIALHTMVDVPDALAVVKVVVTPVIVNPDQHEKQKPGDKEPGDKQIEANGYHLRKQQRRPPEGDASLAKAIWSALTPSFRLQEIRLQKPLAPLREPAPLRPPLQGLQQLQQLSPA